MQMKRALAKRGFPSWRKNYRMFPDIPERVACGIRLRGLGNAIPRGRVMNHSTSENNDADLPNGHNIIAELTTDFALCWLTETLDLRQTIAAISGGINT